MVTLPRFGLLVALAACLAVTVAAVYVPDTLFWSRVAPERYLAGARAFVAPEMRPDAFDAGRVLPDAVVAWRRLVRAHDVAAFERLAETATPAGRLYGLAGLRLLAPARADERAPQLQGEADSVFVASSCIAGRMTLARAVRVLDVPAWADSLFLAQPKVSVGCPLTKR